jgi:hypothetical protein
MDLTIVYYTANLIDEQFASNIRNELLKFNLPIISVSHKPLDFGDNLCVFGLEPCIYNVYRQILMGAEKVQTKYIACCEDDSLYTPEHFEHRPTDDVFIYNTNRWRVYPNKYLFKHRRHPTSAGMWNCIAPTELMVKTLQTRFEKYPVKGSQIGWGEPGRHEEYLGLPPVKAYAFQTEIPNVTFAHDKGLGGMRRTAPSDTIQSELPYWGSAKDLWKRMWDGK